DGLRYFFLDLYETVFRSEQTKEVTVHDIRAIEILDKHTEHYLFGFDVSHYQYRIDWKIADSLYQKYPLDFVFIRSTMGIDGIDYEFKTNWKYAKTRLLVRGAYHYYRPDENSTLQAQNFIKTLFWNPEILYLFWILKIIPNIRVWKGSGKVYKIGWKLLKNITECSQ